MAIDKSYSNSKKYQLRCLARLKMQRPELELHAAMLQQLQPYIEEEKAEQNQARKWLQTETREQIQQRLAAMPEPQKTEWRNRLNQLVKRGNTP